MCRCIGAGTIEPRGAVSLQSYMNRYSQRLGGGPFSELNELLALSMFSLYKYYQK